MSEKTKTLKEGITPKPCPSCGKWMYFDQNTGKHYCRNPDCPLERKP